MQGSQALNIVKAGAAAAALLLLAALGQMSFMASAPLLPLFWIGFGQSLAAATGASGVALLLILVLAGGTSALVMLVVHVLPALYTVAMSRLFRDTPEGRQWYPVQAILAGLCAYAALLFVAAAFYYAGQEGGIAAELRSSASANLDQLDGDVKIAAGKIADTAGFLIVGAQVWGIVLLTYVMALAAHLYVKWRGLTGRPHLLLQEGEPPVWVLPALGLAAGLSLTATGQVLFAGKALLVIFMLPHFIYGMAMIHRWVRGWPGRELVLFCIYASLLLLATLPLVVAIGVVRHAMRLGSALPANRM